MTWTPEGASIELEKAMEEKDLHESDRDEVRKWAEMLRRRSAKKKGEELAPMTEEMKKWILGQE
jgi:hypothetical protein